jgi:hypothetical protein
MLTAPSTEIARQVGSYLAGSLLERGCVDRVLFALNGDDARERHTVTRADGIPTGKLAERIVETTNADVDGVSVTGRRRGGSGERSREVASSATLRSLGRVPTHSPRTAPEETTVACRLESVTPRGRTA